MMEPRDYRLAACSWKRAASKAQGVSRKAVSGPRFDPILRREPVLALNRRVRLNDGDVYELLNVGEVGTSA